MASLQTIKIRRQHNDRIGQCSQRLIQVGLAVMQHVTAHCDHFIGQYTGTLLLHGHEGQIETLEFILDGSQGSELRGILCIGFEVVTNDCKAGIQVLANPAER